MNIESRGIPASRAGAANRGSRIRRGAKIPRLSRHVHCLGDQGTRLPYMTEQKGE